jgi:hypothetical protein
MTEKSAIHFRSTIFNPARKPMEPDWILLCLPTILAVCAVHARGGLLLAGLAVATAYLRRHEGVFQIQPGPFVALILAAALSFGRPQNLSALLLFLMVCILIFNLIATVDARRIIRSLIDGCGVYLVVIVLAYAAGFRSSAYNFRIGGLVESTGSVRILFPLAGSINISSAIASIVIVAFPFLIVEKGSLRRALRSASLLAAAFVMFGAGSRSAILVSAALPLIVLSAPATTRWLAQAATVLAATFAFVRPWLASGLGLVVAPLTFLIPGRETTNEGVISLQGRDQIWAGSIKYWQEWIHDLPDVLFGFGTSGQYRSGASGSYSTLLEGTVRNPERAYVHNSFLQQLFDGGVVGFALLAVAAFWASARLAKRTRDWGNYGMAATVALTVLLLVGITEVAVAPGPAQLTFWIFLVLVGVSCQVKEQPAPVSRVTVQRGIESVRASENPQNSSLGG